MIIASQVFACVWLMWVFVDKKFDYYFSYFKIFDNSYQIKIDSVSQNKCLLLINICSFRIWGS